MINKISIGRQSALIMFFLVLGLVGSIFLSGEFLAADLDSNNLFELAFENRSASLKDELGYDLTDDAMDSFIYQFDQEELKTLVKSDYFKLLSGKNNRLPETDTIAFEEAIDDVDFLIKTLKFGYAGYQINGGDERFNQARGEIIIELENWLTSDNRIFVKEFEEILYSEINFIEDTHFSIAGRQMGSDYSLYVSNEYIFNKVEKDGKIYYKEFGDNGRFLSLGDKGSEEVMWPVLGQSGQLVYLPGFFKPYDSDYSSGIKDNIKFELEDGEEVNEVEVVLYPLRSVRQQQDSNIYQSSEIDGIPLIEVNSFAARDNESSQQLEKFVEDSSDLSDAENLIIDIRGNTGGSDHYPYSWIQNFTGQKDISRNSLSVNVRTDVSYALMENSLNKFPAEQRAQLMQQLKELFMPLDNGWGDVNIAVPKFIPNETKIIVIIDSYVMSAGESFVRYLKQMENVIFIGSNTRGMGMVGNVGSFNLFNSEIEVHAGVTIFMDTDMKNREGMGYMPDFWVDDSQALGIAVEILSGGI